MIRGSGRRPRRTTTKALVESTNSTDSPITCLRKSIWDDRYQTPSICKLGAKSQGGNSEIKKTMSNTRRDPYLRPLVLDIPHGLSEDEQVYQKDDLKVPTQRLENSKVVKQGVDSSPERKQYRLKEQSHACRKSSFEVKTDQSNCAQNKKT